MIEEFRHAAPCAIAAGADGVEIHGANGYLVHQFLAPNTNVRTDAYGGSVENRSRLAYEIAKAVSEEVGAGRTGIRLAPGNPFNDSRSRILPSSTSIRPSALPASTWRTAPPDWR